jgi:hypothetical protein
MNSERTRVSNNKLFYAIGAVIILMLGYLIFKDSIHWYFKKSEILKRVSVFNIPFVADDCYEFQKALIVDPQGDIVWSKSCEDEVKKYSSKIKYWEKLIRHNNDLNCDDFEDIFEAIEFYHYVSGEAAEAYYKRETPDGLVLRTNGLVCAYDPYGLDTDHDCDPCEH